MNMNKEELEKMFDDKFPATDLHHTWTIMWWKYECPFPSEAKQFIFETIIPEVLKSVLIPDLKDFCKTEEEKEAFKFVMDTANWIYRLQAKELYWIDL